MILIELLVLIVSLITVVIFDHSGAVVFPTSGLTGTCLSTQGHWILFTHGRSDLVLRIIHDTKVRDLIN